MTTGVPGLWFATKCPE